jgi:hypothetical protein
MNCEIVIIIKSYICETNALVPLQVITKIVIIFYLHILKLLVLNSLVTVESKEAVGLFCSLKLQVLISLHKTNIYYLLVSKSKQFSYLNNNDIY